MPVLQCNNSVNLGRIYKYIFFFQGKRIIGATCSTDRAQQYLLRSSINPIDGVQFYFCDCFGHYGTGSQSVDCTIHYWECPLIT